ncbi:hypothetical protein JZM24_07910 [Candidatus Sodalis endolongispinus]|uniref:Uncharacterized protein n=1 Tax=Candidatus Sodalis endolongispinus TaxID=2812662 RepID=A0ABS5YAV3_9GAMM|nr:hypothetical protein [Candidatus Sodalis endolongispinus]MBT9432066.1 hypothetical protein [Candidatus Sodalis endolongispinus]
MIVYSLQQLVAIARQASPFYRHLYRDLGSTFQLQDLPIARFEDVMAAVHADFRSLFTRERLSGMFYTTSGTTGRPKETLFGREEWRTINRLLAMTHWRNGLLRDGDVVLNLSEPGSASFMAVHRVVDVFAGRCAEIPLGCDRDYDDIIAHYQAFNANVITGMNPIFLGLAHRLLTTQGPDPRITRLLGGGQNLMGFQAALLRDAFPNATLYPFLYGTTEVGQVAWSAAPTGQNAYCPFSELCTVEIVDLSSGDVIRRPSVQGALVVTSYARLQAPAIRMDTGDNALWWDPPDAPAARFALHGRRFVNRYPLAATELDSRQVSALIERLFPDLPLLMLWVEITGNNNNPQLTIVLSLHGRAAPPANVERQALAA